jgi:hypothetical protein
MAAARMANLKRGGDRGNQFAKVPDDTLPDSEAAGGISRSRAAKLFAVGSALAKNGSAFLI